MKILHLDHLEDMIFDGNFIQAYDTLEALVDSVRGTTVRGLDVTTKYDGSPAVVFGRNPENGKLFIGTKSVFNKRYPLIAYSPEDIDTMYGNKPELANKLKAVCHNINRFPEGVWQGDLLWTHDSIKTDKDHIEFTPNTITYKFEGKHPDAEEMYDREIGIVIHTKYVGETMAEMMGLPATRDDVHEFSFYDNNAYIVDPTVSLDSIRIQEDMQIQLLDEHMSALEMADITNSARTCIAATKHHSPMLKMFINYCVRMGEVQPTPSMYKVFLKNRGERVLAEEVEERGSFKLLFILHTRITFVKKLLLDIMSQNSYFQSYVSDQKIKGEGFVVSYFGYPCKLVDRLEFSRLNFLKHDKVKQ